MEVIPISKKIRTELKKIRGQKVRCSAKLGLQVFERSLFDGRNYETHVIEKRLIMKKVKIYDELNYEIIKYDHIWIMEDSFNDKNEFNKLLKLVSDNEDKALADSFSEDESEIAAIKIEFYATVTGYIKNHVYNEFSKKFHSNFDYGLKQIDMIDTEIIYKEKKRTSLNKNKTKEEKHRFEGVVVKYDAKMFKNIKKEELVKNNPACVQRLVDIDRQVKTIAQSDDDNGVKENQLNQLKHEIKKMKKKKLKDVCEYLERNQTEKKINDLIYSFHNIY